MLWLVTDQVKLFIYSPLDSPCLFWADNKVFICLSVPGWSLWSGFNRPTFWMFWSRCDVTHISWRKHQQATSSTIYSTSCWIKEVVMRSPISFWYHETLSWVSDVSCDEQKSKYWISEGTFPRRGSFPRCIASGSARTEIWLSNCSAHLNGQEIELME